MHVPVRQQMHFPTPHRESVGSSAQTSLPAKLTKTITLPPLRGLVGGVGHSKRGKSGKREAKVKKSVKSSKTVANKEQKVGYIYMYIQALGWLFVCSSISWGSHALQKRHCNSHCNSNAP